MARRASPCAANKEHIAVTDKPANTNTKPKRLSKSARTHKRRLKQIARKTGGAEPVAR